MRKRRIIRAQNAHCELARTQETTCFNTSHQQNFCSFPPVSSGRPRGERHGIPRGAMRHKTWPDYLCASFRPAQLAAEWS